MMKGNRIYATFCIFCLERWSSVQPAEYPARLRSTATRNEIDTIPVINLSLQSEPYIKVKSIEFLREQDIVRDNEKSIQTLQWVEPSNHLLKVDRRGEQHSSLSTKRRVKGETDETKRTSSIRLAITKDLMKLSLKDRVSSRNKKDENTSSGSSLKNTRPIVEQQKEEENQKNRSIHSRNITPSISTRQETIAGLPQKSELDGLDEVSRLFIQEIFMYMSMATNPPTKVSKSLLRFHIW
jgi:hypothetical protein